MKTKTQHTPTPETYEHTPTPWTWNVLGVFQGNGKVKEGDRYIFPVYHSPSISKSETRGNMEFIVRAVNSHEALLKEIKKVREDARRNGSDYDYRALDEAIAQADGK